MAIREEKVPAPVSRVQIARYAGAVGDFNPIHLDDEFARAAGMPSVIAHGPLTLTLAIDRLVAQCGADALRSFDARLKAPVFPKDHLSIAPVEGGIEVKNQEGKTVVAATVKTV